MVVPSLAGFGLGNGHIPSIFPVGYFQMYPSSSFFFSANITSRLMFYGLFIPLPELRYFAVFSQRIAPSIIILVAIYTIIFLIFLLLISGLIHFLFLITIAPLSTSLGTYPIIYKSASVSGSGSSSVAKHYKKVNILFTRSIIIHLPLLISQMVYSHFLTKTSVLTDNITMGNYYHPHGESISTTLFFMVT